MQPQPTHTPFGKYLLVRKIASGGMAEVYLAVLRGAAGFEKTVALKRVLPFFSAEREFVTLFQDEARIVSTLAHANIAQVFDFGEVDGSFYLTMELVDGSDLARLAERMREAGQPMPQATAAFIVAEAARGLAYAHDRRGPDGRLLGLVHRDVSPQNILVSYAGEVKVTDFGIAKAAGKAHKTATGMLMGKLRYMSPEQVNGEEIDARTDVFALGVILYELLTGGPIFPGEQTVRLAELIHRGDIPPPSARNPAIPAALDAIVLRALAREREDRYPRAAELARDLTVYVNQTAPGFTREDLAALVVRLVPPVEPDPVGIAHEATDRQQLDGASGDRRPTTAPARGGGARATAGPAGGDGASTSPGRGGAAGSGEPVDGTRPLRTSGQRLAGPVDERGPVAAASGWGATAGPALDERVPAGASPPPVPSWAGDRDELRQLDVATRTRLPAADERPRPRRGGLSREAWIGLALGAVILVSGALVVVRLVLPASEGAPDAEPAAPLADDGIVPLAGDDAGTDPAGDAAGLAAQVPDAAPSGPFAPLAEDRRTDLLRSIEGHPVVRRGTLSKDYVVFVTALDWMVATLAVDGQGRGSTAPFSPELKAAIDAEQLAEPVKAVGDYLRATGELPPRVRVHLEPFLGRSPAIGIRLTDLAGNVVPSYSAAALAAWLTPRDADRLADVAFANEALGRWRKPPTGGRRHLFPELVEREAFLAALKALAPKDPAVAALERWDLAFPVGDAVQRGDARVRVKDVAYEEDPADRGAIVATVALVVEDAAKPPSPTYVVVAGGMSEPRQHYLLDQPEAPTAGPVPTWVQQVKFRLPARIYAPVLQIQGGGETVSMRLPSPRLLRR